jgi:pilus assembly protein Flp/PilA
MEKIKKFFADESGSNATEYGLIIALVSLAILVGATALGTGLDALFTRVSVILGAA